MKKWKAYSFEAKAIQKFVFASGKLRDAIGASALIDALAMPASETGAVSEVVAVSLFDHVCAVAGLPFGAGVGGYKSAPDGGMEIEAGVVRKAGGVVSFVWQSGGEDTPNAIDEAFARFRPLWTVAVREAVPGIEFIEGVGIGDDVLSALDDVQRVLGVARNRPVIGRPSITPLVALAPRTGAPATSRAHGVMVDRATMAKTTGHWTNADGVAANLLETPGDWQWPIDLEDQGDVPKGQGVETDGGNGAGNTVAFPFRGRGNGDANRLIGLLHIDGNGLGQSLIAVREAVSDQAKSGDAKAVINRLYQFSVMIQDVTVKAARSAMESVIDTAFPQKTVGEDGIKPVLPVRPILLGGDDITVLLRADCAVAFAKSFITAFEREARAHPNAPEGVAPMTACGGLVFAGASHPFAKLAGLAESLCAHAKAEAKLRAAKRAAESGQLEPVPGALSIHRIKTADHGEYEDIVAQELTVRDSGLVLTMNPYFIQDPGKNGLQLEAPALSDLEKLGDLLSEDGFARGPLRELMSLMYLPPAQAKQRYRRWCSILRKGDKQTKLWSRYCAAIGALRGQTGLDAKIIETLFDIDITQEGATPLLDALMLEGMGREQAKRQEAGRG